MKECQQCKQCYPDDIAICPEDGMPTYHTISGEPVLEGKYKLDKRLGQGGMGVVYCARHAYLKTQHAIKVILPDLVGNDPQLVTRFRQEALAAAAIRHHNVIAVTDFGVAMGTMPFLVMEFVEGESLHDLLAREHRLSPERAVELMSAICAGVGAAHRQGIVHRDLKPLNIMIQTDRGSLGEAVKILDFGLAKIKSGELLGSFIQAQTTGLMGSPYYMAPEQWADEEPDAQADIYSLGIMLFQMIAGDVPIKGSSIPAIMQKHLNSPPPSFAEFGVQVSPQIELAVRHALEKKRDDRTKSTEQLVDELRTAIGVSSGSISSANVSQTAGLAPVSSLHVFTKPPQSKVFVNNVSVGESKDNGWFLLEGLQSGNHRLRVSHDGFQDWETELISDGTPQQVVAELQNAGGMPIPSPYETHIIGNQTGAGIQNPAGTQNLAQTQNSTAVHQSTMPHVLPNQSLQNQTSAGLQGTHGNLTQVAPARSGMSGVMLAITGILGVLLLFGIGVGGAFMMGWIGKTNVANVNTNGAIETPGNSNTNQPPPVAVKNEMVLIPGGKFKMGRDDGDVIERPSHQVTVRDFWMDKTEVTNAEFFSFVNATGYSPIPKDWDRGRPLPNEEQFPVRFVNFEDVEAFAKWRSERDKVTYRLPTEEEWEYAARNGEENNLYPWGDVWDDSRAVVNSNFTFEPVGSKPSGANKWGVLGLIGNVWEWTSSLADTYPGADAEVVKQFNSSPFKQNKNVIVRGVYVPSKGNDSRTSTFRAFASPKNRDKVIGFRLVRDK